MAQKLTTRSVETAKADGVRREIPDGLLPGLYLVVQPSGAKSWAVRYRHAGQPRKYTLGSWPAVDLATARELGREALLKAKRGRDPGDERKAAHQAVKAAARDEIGTVIGEFIEKYAKVHTRGWRATENILRTHVLSQWQGRPVQTIGKRDVLDLLDGIVARGKPIMANRVLAHTRKLFAWCVDRDILAASPVAGIKTPAPERSRDHTLNDAELRTVLLAARSIGWPYGAVVEMLALTGCRLREVGDMIWPELDLGARVWRLPGSRTKNGVSHDVPLSDQALAILNGAPHIAGKAGYVFTLSGNRPQSFAWCKEKLDRACAEPVQPWRFHDLRRVVATGMARLGVNLPVIEKCLNHAGGSFAGIVSVYQKHSFADEKRAALQRWADHVERLINPTENVVPFSASHGVAVAKTAV